MDSVVVDDDDDSQDDSTKKKGKVSRANGFKRKVEDSDEEEYEEHETRKYFKRGFKNSLFGA